MPRPPRPLFGVRVEHRAREALEAAERIWPNVEHVWEAIEWTLVRDPGVGAMLSESGRIRAFVFEGARSVGWPDVRIIYEESPDLIVISRCDVHGGQGARRARLTIALREVSRRGERPAGMTRASRPGSALHLRRMDAKVGTKT